MIRSAIGATTINPELLTRAAMEVAGFWFPTAGVLGRRN
jgi:hypothetical protein